MRPYRFVLLLAIAASFSSPASALAQQQRRWKQIGVTGSNNPVFVDPKSVTKADGIITATLRVQFTEPVKAPSGTWTSSRTVASFDCAKRRVMVKENTYYVDEKRNKIAERKVPKIPGWGPALGGALPGVAMQYLCAQ